MATDRQAHDAQRDADRDAERDALLERANRPAAESLRMHAHYRGKIQTSLKVPVRHVDDFSIWYTPGVAAPCLAIADDAAKVYDYTNKANTVAIVTDGTRVLGLGDIGPRGGMPVMEGKALLFKYLGGVDAVPLCLDTKSAEDIINTVRLVQPTFGGINLEDISQPKCFEVLDTLRADPSIEIPVFHDDQQGTATVLLAGLYNALKVTNRDILNTRFAMVGMGAANVATLRLLLANGVCMDQIIACDSRGILNLKRDDVISQQAVYPDKHRLCRESNPEGRTGGPEEAMRGADVLIAFAAPGPGVIKPEWVAGMAKDAIVFACSNPVPEIWPWEASEAGARIVGTGRSDFANQLNNSLGFPGIFRGAWMSAPAPSPTRCAWLPPRRWRWRARKRAWTMTTSSPTCRKRASIPARQLPSGSRPSSRVWPASPTRAKNCMPWPTSAFATPAPWSMP
jgi:malate dehydrogenase (oxaloacetate-decarboxylating)